MKTIIAYHGNCPDGFGAAWWLKRTMYPEAELFAASHDNFDAVYDLDLAGARLIVADFCYPTEQLATLAKLTAEMLVLDHHETAREWLIAESVTGLQLLDDPRSQYVGTLKHRAVFSKHMSGAGLAARFVQHMTGIKPPEFLAHIEDRDLWRWALKDTKDVFAAVTAVPQTMEAWNDLLVTPMVQLVNRGAAMNQYRDQLIDEVLKQPVMLLELDGVRIPAVSCPYALGSEVAGRLAADHDGVGAYFIVQPGGCRVGLRSTPVGPDVAVIAEKYGGGGHVRASGCRIQWVPDTAFV